MILIGRSREAGRLSVFERTIERPIGVAFDGRRLAIASMVQITTLADAAKREKVEGGYDAVFMRQTATFRACDEIIESEGGQQQY